MIEAPESRSPNLICRAVDIVVSPVRLIEERRAASLNPDSFRIITGGAIPPTLGTVYGFATFGPVWGTILGVVNFTGIGILARWERNALRTHLRTTQQ